MKNIIIDKTKCNSCKQCEKDCTGFAISIDKFTIKDSCILCGHCVAICKQQAISFKNKEIVLLDNNLPTPEQFYNLTTHTRTCRSFTSEPISIEVIEKLIQMSVQAPSASNVRGIKLTILTNKEKLNSINRDIGLLLLKKFELFTKPVIKQTLQLFASKEQITKLVKYKNKFKKAVVDGRKNITFDAPALIMFHAKPERFGMLESDANIWATYISLYASSMGLGTCFNGFIVKGFGQDKKIQEKYGVPQDHKVYITLLLGYPNKQYYNEVSRDTAINTIIV